MGATSPGAQTQPFASRVQSVQVIFSSHRRHLDREREVGVQHEGGAVEDEFVLAAELVHIGERQAALLDAADGELHARVVLVEVVGRTVRHEDDLGARCFQAFDHVGEPDVLADGHADADTANVEGAGHRALVEDAGLVEDGIIRQVDLGAVAADLALVEIEDGVEELAVVGEPGAADEDAGAAVAGLARELDGGGAGGILKGALQDQVFRRIAGEKEFGKDDELRALDLGGAAGLDGLFEIARDVAHDGVQLGEGYAELIGHFTSKSGRLRPKDMGIRLRGFSR